MDALAPCEYLPWDSAFFGRQIARVVGSRLDRDSAERVADWCRVHSIECLYFLADLDDVGTVRAAEDHGFRLVDVRVSLARSLDRPPEEASSAPGGVIRRAGSADVAELRRIARTSHTDSRFYADDRFTRERCDELYATWIERSCGGYADHVLVAELDGCPVGYLSCHLVDGTIGTIGLFGIAAEAQGRGLGSGLLTRALCWFVEQGARRATVVTQGRNVAGQRVYQRCGFVTESMGLWYHRWFV